MTKTMYKPLIAVPPTPLVVSVAIPSSSCLDSFADADHRGNSDAPSKINLICNLVRSDLEKRDVFHYANTILTAHVRKSPPDYESALNVLASLKGELRRVSCCAMLID